MFVEMASEWLAGANCTPLLILTEWVCALALVALGAVRAVLMLKPDVERVLPGRLSALAVPSKRAQMILNVMLVHMACIAARAINHGAGAEGTAVSVFAVAQSILAAAIGGVLALATGSAIGAAVLMIAAVFIL